MSVLKRKNKGQEQAHGGGACQQQPPDHRGWAITAAQLVFDDE